MRRFGCGVHDWHVNDAGYRSWFTARIPSSGAVLQLGVATADQDAVAVAYADPSGAVRSVRHAALAAVEVTVHRPGRAAMTLTSSSGAYEYGTSQGIGQTELEDLPVG